MQKKSKMKKLIGVLVVVLVCGYVSLPGRANAAISFFGAAGIPGFAVDTSSTWSQDITGISNPILIAGCISRTGDLVGTTTWNGTENFTKLGHVQLTANNDWLSLWYLIPSAIGNHQIKCILSSSQVTSGGSSAYSGAAQTQSAIVSNTVITAQTATQDLTTRTTSTVDNSWIVGAGLNTSGNGVASTTGDGGTTSVVREGFYVGPPQAAILDSNSAVTPAGGYSMHFLTSGGTTPWNLGAVTTAIEPAVTAGGAVAPRNYARWWVVQ